MLHCRKAPNQKPTYNGKSPTLGVAYPACTKDEIIVAELRALNAIGPSKSIQTVRGWLEHELLNAPPAAACNTVASKGSATWCRFIESGGVYKLAFGPKAFIVVSDPVVVRHLLKVSMSYGCVAYLAAPLEVNWRWQLCAG